MQTSVFGADALPPQTFEDAIPRDRWNRPLILQPDGSKKAYTRCTTFLKSIDGDPSNLILFNQRHTALGIAQRKDLYMAVATAGDGTSPESKKALNRLVKEAAEASGVHASATIGTALHKATENLDRGEPIDKLPAVFKDDLEAYRRTIAGAGLESLQVEVFGVQDELEVGGTWDRIFRHNGRNYIGDVKTGRVDDFAIGKISLQLATYAHCKMYDPGTGARTDLPDVDQDRALIVHLPQGTGSCALIWVDIKAGWEAVQIAARARKWQAYAKMKNISTPFDAAEALAAPVTAPQPPAPATAPPAAVAPAAPAPAPAPVAADRSLLNAIAEAGTLPKLTELWNEFHTVWTPEHSAAATARKNELQAMIAAAVAAAGGAQ